MNPGRADSGVADIGQLRPDQAPPYLAPVLEGVRDIDGPALSRHQLPPAADSRRAAVLILVGSGPTGPDVLLLERAAQLRSHPGQVSFPGGSIDPGDSGPIAAALREAAEETGLDPSGVIPLALLPDLFIPPSNFVVTPVLAHWAHPVAVHAVDPAETTRAGRVPVAVLADPDNRLSVSHPSGFVGPAFIVGDLLIWGFTGSLLSALLDLGGWGRPWDHSRIHDLDVAWSPRPGRASGGRPTMTAGSVAKVWA